MSSLHFLDTSYNNILNGLENNSNFTGYELGLDEAGRGVLFGRLYASGVIWDLNILTPEQINKLKEIKDSKKLSKKKRNELRIFIETYCKAFVVEWSEPDEIDSINILEANRLCFKRILYKINQSNIQFSKLVIDGNQFNFPFLESHGHLVEQRCVPKADSKYISVASASILAKEYHDEYIRNLCCLNPILFEYKMDKHVGYATKEHRELIEKKGITNLHRKTFATCTNKLCNYTLINSSENKPYKLL